MKLLFQKHHPEKSIMDFLEIFAILAKSNPFCHLYEKSIMKLLRTQWDPPFLSIKFEGSRIVLTLSYLQLSSVYSYKDEPNPEYEP